MARTTPRRLAAVLLVAFLLSLLPPARPLAAQTDDLLTMDVVPALPGPPALAAPSIPVFEPLGVPLFPGLALDVTLSDRLPVVGTTLTVTLLIANRATHPADAVVLTMPLPAGTAAADPLDPAWNGTHWQWELGQLAAETTIMHAVAVTLVARPPGDALVVEPQVYPGPGVGEETIRYTYDAAWRQTSVCIHRTSSCFAGAATFTALQQPLTLTLGNGLQHRWTYGDGLARLTRLQVGTSAVPGSLLNGQVVALRERSGTVTTTSYPHGDHLGSVSLVSTSSGALASQQEYDAWGQVRLLPNQTQLPIQQTGRNYTGQERDGTGLLYYKAWYDTLALFGLLPHHTIPS